MQSIVIIGSGASAEKSKRANKAVAVCPRDSECMILYIKVYDFIGSKFTTADTTPPWDIIELK